MCTYETCRVKILKEKTEAKQNINTLLNDYQIANKNIICCNMNRKLDNFAF